MSAAPNDASLLEQLRFWMQSAHHHFVHATLLSVLEKGRAESPEDYAGIWLPYMEGLGLPTFTVNRVEDLDRLGRLLPTSARVALHLHEPPGGALEAFKPLCDALLASPGLPLVCQLTLRGNRSAAFWGVALACAAHGRLEELTCIGGSLFAHELSQLIESPSAPGLRSIRLYSGTSREDLLALAASPDLGALRTLDLGEYPVGVEALPALVASPALAGLEHLHLAYAPLGPEGAAALAEAWALSRLRSLTLKRCRLGDAGLLALVRNPLLQSVTRWNLEGNDLGPAAAQALASMDGEEGFELINLRGNALGDVGAQAFLTGPRLVFETLLILSSNGLTDSAALALAKLPCGHVELGGNRLSDAGWEAFWRQRGSVAATHRRVPRFERRVGRRATPHK